MEGGVTTPLRSHITGFRYSLHQSVPQATTGTSVAKLTLKRGLGTKDVKTSNSTAGIASEGKKIHQGCYVGTFSRPLSQVDASTHPGNP
jgi:hypothetical protein